VKLNITHWINQTAVSNYNNDSMDDVGIKLNTWLMREQISQGSTKQYIHVLTKSWLRGRCLHNWATLRHDYHYHYNTHTCVCTGKLCLPVRGMAPPLRGHAVQPDTGSRGSSVAVDPRPRSTWGQIAFWTPQRLDPSWVDPRMKLLQVIYIVIYTASHIHSYHVHVATVVIYMLSQLSRTCCHSCHIHVITAVMYMLLQLSYICCHSCMYMLSKLSSTCCHSCHVHVVTVVMYMSQLSCTCCHRCHLHFTTVVTYMLPQFSHTCCHSYHVHVVTVVIYMLSQLSCTCCGYHTRCHSYYNECCHSYHFYAVTLIICNMYMTLLQLSPVSCHTHCVYCHMYTPTLVMCMCHIYHVYITTFVSYALSPKWCHIYCA